MAHKTRWILWPILAIGIALVVAPLAISLPSKAAAGQRMLDAFHPIMQPAAVQKTVAYQKVFADIGPVATAALAGAPEVPKLFSELATETHMTPAQLAAFLNTNVPVLAQLLSGLPPLSPVFQQVNPGLTWYKPIVSTMQANVADYAKVDGLPDMNLFVWFFAGPGALLVLLSGWGLVGSYRRRAVAAVVSAPAPTRRAA
jgi:hypothetical protein